MTDNISLVQRLAKATAEVGGKLKADKRNGEQGYNYVSADKILSACGQALADNGVVVIPSIVHYDINIIDRGNGKSRYDATVDLVLKVTDGATSFEEPWYGMGSDYSVPDKALYKAITSGHKYFLSKLFCIGEGNEDSEHDEGERSERTTDQLSRDLGYEPAAPRPAPVPAMPAEMSIEDAEAIVNGQGTPYGTLPTDKITFALNSVRKSLEKEPNPAYEHKARALEIILAARRAGRPVQS